VSSTGDLVQVDGAGRVIAVYDTTRDLPWVRWLDEERERQATRAPETTLRPSIVLRESTVDYVDRIAKLQGLTRSELVESMIGLYRSSWRPIGVSV
jgi:hypothetical protein